MEDISEEEDMVKDVHKGFLISDESGSNDNGRDTESESLISTSKVEIKNDDE